MVMNLHKSGGLKQGGSTRSKRGKPMAQVSSEGSGDLSLLEELDQLGKALEREIEEARRLRGEPDKSEKATEPAGESVPASADQAGTAHSGSS
jgi:hypothetical protein